MEETDNYNEADSVLSKGIAIANKSNYYALTLQLKYASVKVISGSNNKSGLRLLDSCLSDAQIVEGNTSAAVTLYGLHFLKVSVLFASGAAHDYTQAIEVLNKLENEREQQRQIACMAYVIHALKLIQKRQTTEAKELLDTVQEIEGKVKMDITNAQTYALESNTQPVVIFPIVIQVTMVRIICQVIISLESCTFDRLDRSINELMQLVESPALREEGVWTPEGMFYLPLASSKNGNAGPESTFLAVNWISHTEATILSLIICGIAKLWIASETRAAKKYLLQALQVVKAEASWTLVSPPNGPPAKHRPDPPLFSLALANERQDQLRLLKCYTLFYLCIESFLLSQWSDSAYLQELLQTAQSLPPHLNGKFLPQTFYLSGVFFQASGNAHNAIQFYLKLRAHLNREAELYLLATINLILVLEAPDQIKYNTFQSIPLTTERQRDRRGANTPAQLFRYDIESVCVNHVNPMIRWAWKLVDLTYNTVGQTSNDSKGTQAPQSGNELAIQNKLSTLVNYAMKLNCFQLGSIVAYLSTPRADPKERQIALASRGVNDAYKSRDALWMWMNGLALEDLFKQTGKTDMAQRQHQNNEISKKSVETRLNRVD